MGNANGVRLRPPTIFWLSLLAAAGLHFVLPNLPIIDWPYRWLGVALALGGTGLMLWAVRLFERRGTTHNMRDTSTMLLADGPLAFTRNPMYLGMTAMLVGIAVLAGTIPMFVAPLAFWLTMQLVIVPWEEKRLEAIFGSEYLDYRKRVRRWL